MDQNPQLSFILVWPDYQLPTLVQQELQEKAQSDIKNFFERWKIPFQITFTQPQKISESISLQRGANLILTSAELNVPLGDLLKLLQVLNENKKIQISFGNRVQKQKNPFLSASHKRSILERKVTSLYSEQLKGLFSDPLCPAIALPLQLAQELTQNLDHIAWPAAIRKFSIQREWRSAEVPVIDWGENHSTFPEKKLYLKYLWNSFRL